MSMEISGPFLNVERGTERAADFVYVGDRNALTGIGTEEVQETWSHYGSKSAVTNYIATGGPESEPSTTWVTSVNYDGAIFYGSPVVDGSHAYFPVSAGSGATRVYKVDIESGEVAGTFDTTADLSSHSRTSLDGFDGANLYCSGDNGVVALDKGDGSVVAENTNMTYNNDSPAVHDGVLYFGTTETSSMSSEGQVALDAETLEVIWSKERAPLNWGWPGKPAVGNGLLYMNGGSDMNHTGMDTYAVDIEDGSIAWEQDLPGTAETWVNAQYAADEDAMYHGGYMYDGVETGWFAKQNAADGSIEWVNSNLPGGGSYMIAPMTISDDYVAAMMYPYLCVVDRETGDLVHEFDNDGAWFMYGDSAVPASGNIMYGSTGSPDGANQRLYAFDADAGEMLWDIAVPPGDQNSSFYHGFAMGNGMIINYTINTSTDTIYMWRLESQ